MDPIIHLAASKRFVVIEDCAQAHGARYRGRSVGTVGHNGAYYFAKTKSRPPVARVAWSRPTTGSLLADVVVQGSWEELGGHNQQQNDLGFRLEHDSCGAIWRMLKMQATICRVQLRLLPE